MKKISAAIGVATVIAALAACGSSTSTGTAAKSTKAAAVAATSSAAVPTTPAAKPKPPAPPAAPKLTASQQQAVTSAKSYLSLGSGFSRLGLIGQLSSTSGEGFPVADATYAVDSLHVDWNAQAVLSAKGYIKLGGFSRASLIDQLSSSSGEQFTLAQAQYAVAQVGL